mmetsp:Transcript_67174/g.149027  ORF Transcript_67174/g.149027 Transcript_67174/m.149027 type:complete len:383 (+) Transcript_67174:1-1149(+)
MEGEAQGGSDYWWHGQGYFTGTHAIVDKLAAGSQTRGLGRAAFNVVAPDVFPEKGIIFLSNGKESDSMWAETRRAMHEFWLSEDGPNYTQRQGNLKALLKETWTKPSLQSLASIEDMGTMVCRCIFYVFFGQWLSEEEAQTLGRWATAAQGNVLPRFVHRLMFGYFIVTAEDMRVETIGLIRSHKLEHVFAKMNSTFSNKNRRKFDIDLCNELMFVLGFAGIGGPTRAAASVGKFLLAQGSEDAANIDFSGANSKMMIALFKKDPKAFIMETCRVSAPVGTFTTELSAADANDLGLKVGSAPSVHLAGVINLSNTDPKVFPDPFKFDPARPNLPDALTWNGKAFSSRECDYPRICPGRDLSVQIVRLLAEIALDAEAATAGD